jgi:SAM-dependent methyltransferase
LGFVRRIDDRENGFALKFTTLKNVLRLESLRRHAIGFCPVCSRRTVFLITDTLQTIRNHALCAWCKSCSRNRHAALTILDRYASQGVAALQDFKHRPDLTVLNTSSRSPLSRALGSGRNIYNSEYFEDVPPGGEKNGVRCENLEALAFPDDSLDLVISEDVFEHVRDLERGFTEVARVLRKGRCHIFTVPFYFDRKTAPLFEKQGEHYEPISFPIEYHGDFIREKIPVYHHLGYDLFEILDKIGFDTQLIRSTYHEAIKYGTFDCYTFVSRKR